MTSRDAWLLSGEYWTARPAVLVSGIPALRHPTDRKRHTTDTSHRHPVQPCPRTSWRSAYYRSGDRVGIRRHATTTRRRPSRLRTRTTARHRRAAPEFGLAHRIRLYRGQPATSCWRGQSPGRGPPHGGRETLPHLPAAPDKLLQSRPVQVTLRDRQVRLRPESPPRLPHVAGSRRRSGPDRKPLDPGSAGASCVLLPYAESEL
jgi:hypothetical protein